MQKTKILLLLISILFSREVLSQDDGALPDNDPIEINGVFPNLTVLGPNKDRSESGIGALIPWADKLWMIGYVAHIKGSRIGLYEIGEEMKMEKHNESVTGTFANRMVHKWSDQAIIGPHFIDIDGNVRTSDELAGHRLTATMEHLTDPENKVYFLTMEGLLFECDVYDLQVKLLFNLVEELDIPNTAYVHFKSGFSGNGRLVVANNSYNERDYLGENSSGRLAEYDGKKWTIIEKKAFVEVSGKMSGNYKGKSIYGNPIFATGWDNKSVILGNFNDRTKEWRTFRLPKGSHCYDHEWNTEWMRIREAQTERFIMDIFGIFYELPMMTYGGDIWGIKPISNHLRLVPDFCFWRGMFVMAGDQTDHSVGQPQSGLLFQNIDDLWSYGKPSGWGSVWRDEDVEQGVGSDPFLMTGFDKKNLHLINHSGYPVTYTIQVDFLGNRTWVDYKSLTVAPHKYVYHIFPEGFSAHWVRIVPGKNCRSTATFFYN